MTRKYGRKSAVRRSQKRRGGLSTKGAVALVTATGVELGVVSVFASGFIPAGAFEVGFAPVGAAFGAAFGASSPVATSFIAGYTYLVPVVIGLSVATGIPTAGIVPLGVAGVAAAGVIIYYTQKELRALIKRHCYADDVLNHFSIFVKCKYNKRVLNEVFNSVIAKYKGNPIFAKMKHGQYAKPLELLDYGIYIPNFFVNFQDFYSDARLFKTMEIGGINDSNYKLFIKDPKVLEMIQGINEIIRDSEDLYKKIENEAENYAYREKLTDIIRYVVDERGLFFDIYKKRINKYAENRIQISKSSNVQSTINDNWNSFIHFFIQSVSIQNKSNNRALYGYPKDVLDSNIRLHASSSPAGFNQVKSPAEREIMVNKLTLTSGASAPLFVKTKDADGKLVTAKRFISMKESSYRSELNRYKGIIKMVRNVDIFYNFIHKSLNEMYTRYIKGERECFRYVMKKINAVKDVYNRYFFILNSSKVNAVSRIDGLNRVYEYYGGLNTSLQTLIRSNEVTAEFVNIVNAYDAEMSPVIFILEQDVKNEREKGKPNAKQEEILSFCKKIGSIFKSANTTKNYGLVKQKIVENNIVSEVRTKLKEIEQELVKNKNHVEKMNEAKKNIGTTTEDVNTGKKIDNFMLLEDVTFNVKKVYVYLNLIYEYLTMDTTKENIENELVDQTVDELKDNIDKIVKKTMDEYVRDISVDKIAYQYKFVYYKLFICELFKIQYFNEIVRVFEKYTVLQKMENIQMVWDIYEQYNEIQEILVFDNDDITPDDKGAIVTFNKILLALTGTTSDMRSKPSAIRSPAAAAVMESRRPESVGLPVGPVPSKSESVSDLSSEGNYDIGSESGSGIGSETASNLGSARAPDVRSERSESPKSPKSELSEDEMIRRLAGEDDSLSEMGSEDLEREFGNIRRDGGNKATIDFLKLDVSKIKSELKKYSDELSKVTNEKFTSLLSKLNKNITYEHLLNEISAVYIMGLYKDETIIKNIVEFFNGNYKTKMDKLYKDILEPFNILNDALRRLNKIVNVLEFIKKRFITAFQLKKSSSLYVMPNDDFYKKYPSINKEVHIELIKDINALNIDSAIDHLKSLGSAILQKSSVPTSRVNFEALKSLLRHIVTNIQLLSLPMENDSNQLYESADKETLVLYLVSTMGELRNAEKELQKLEYKATLEKQEEQRLKPLREREEKERRQKEQQELREQRQREQQAQREEQLSAREKRDQEVEANMVNIRDSGDSVDSGDSENSVDSGSSIGRAEQEDNLPKTTGGGQIEDIKSNIVRIKNNLSKLQSLINRPNVPKKEEDDYLKNKEFIQAFITIKVINKVQVSNTKIALPADIKPPKRKISLTGSESRSMVRDSTMGGYHKKSKRRVMYKHRNTRKSRS